MKQQREKLALIACPKKTEKISLFIVSLCKKYCNRNRYFCEKKKEKSRQMNLQIGEKVIN